MQEENGDLDVKHVKAHRTDNQKRDQYADICDGKDGVDVDGGANGSGQRFNH